MVEERACKICERSSGRWEYCDDCYILVERLKDLEGRDMERGREVMRRQWDAARQAFICEYTGIELSLQGGARDAEWEHRDRKHDPTDVVLVAAVVNRMKGDLTIPEWEAMIRALYRYRIEGDRPFDESALPVNWGPNSTAHARTRRSEVSE
jgi:hypothetical protein